MPKQQRALAETRVSAFHFSSSTHCVCVFILFFCFFFSFCCFRFVVAILHCLLNVELHTNMHVVVVMCWAVCFLSIYFHDIAFIISFFFCFYFCCCCCYQFISCCILFCEMLSSCLPSSHSVATFPTLSHTFLTAYDANGLVTSFLRMHVASETYQDT